MEFNGIHKLNNNEIFTCYSIRPTSMNKIGHANGI